MVCELCVRVSDPLHIVFFLAACWTLLPRSLYSLPPSPVHNACLLFLHLLPLSEELISPISIHTHQYSHPAFQIWPRTKKKKPKNQRALELKLFFQNLCKNGLSLWNCLFRDDRVQRKATHLVKYEFDISIWNLLFQNRIYICEKKHVTQEEAWESTIYSCTKES
jgi:hypothetical protein